MVWTIQNCRISGPQKDAELQKTDSEMLYRLLPVWVSHIAVKFNIWVVLMAFVNVSNSPAVTQQLGNEINSNWSLRATLIFYLKDPKPTMSSRDKTSQPRSCTCVSIVAEGNQYSFIGPSKRLWWQVKELSHLSPQLHPHYAFPQGGYIGNSGDVRLTTLNFQTSATWLTIYKI
jgi:hypothetical protein